MEKNTIRYGRIALIALVALFILLAGMLCGCAAEGNEAVVMKAEERADDTCRIGCLCKECLLRTPCPNKAYGNMYEYFACHIGGEGSVESLDGQISIGATAVARVRCQYDFANDLYGVITEKGQYSSVREDGSIYTGDGKGNLVLLTYDMLSDKTKEAADRALAGENPTEEMLKIEAERLVAMGKIKAEDAPMYYEGGALYFYNPKYCSDAAIEQRAKILVRGKVNEDDAHVFYRHWNQ